MTYAIWIIAVCELVRLVQNSIQLTYSKKHSQLDKELTNEFIDSLRQDNSEWVESMLKEFDNIKEKEE